MDDTHDAHLEAHRRFAAQIPMVIQRPRSWIELGWAFVAGIAVAAVVFAAGVAFAGGPTMITWDQGSDCAAVTGWELVSVPITTSNPNPQPTGAGLSVPKDASGCGLAMSRTVTTTGVGPTRFWLRAVAGATKSAESNSVDASLPLGKPTGLTVAP